MYVLEQGRGRPSYAVLQGYRPRFYFRTTDVTGLIELPEGVEMVMPGDNIKMNVGARSPRSRWKRRPALRDHGERHAQSEQVWFSKILK